MFKVLVGIGALLTPAAAFAQTVSGATIAGPYVSGDIGEGSYSNPLKSTRSLTKIDLGAGVAAKAALGWRFRDGIRVELQGSYQSNGATNISTLRINQRLEPLSNVGGDLKSYSVLANVIYDIPVQRFTAPLQPYIGVGAGYGWLDFGGVGGNGYGIFYLPQHNTYTGADVVSFGTAGAFAYQAIAGVSPPLRTAPGLQLTAEYRYAGTARVETPVSRYATGGNLVNGVVPSAFTHNGFVTGDNVILFGLRYRLGVR